MSRRDAAQTAVLLLAALALALVFSEPAWGARSTAGIALAWGCAAVQFRLSQHTDQGSNR